MAKVDILVLTYNQEKFVRKTLQSLVDQQCPFDFKIIVNDDGSSDGTIKILKEFVLAYPKLIDLQLNEKNLGMPGNFYNAAERSNSDYICLCGGDDFWCDKHKLSKQVEILDKNENVGVVYSDYMTCDEEGNVTGKVKVSKVTFTSLLYKNIIAAVTVCFRRTGYEQYLKDLKPQEKSWLMEDYPMWLWFLANFDVFHMESFTSVYRIGQVSITNNPNVSRNVAFIKSVNSIREFFCERYTLSKQKYIRECGKYDLLHFFMKINDFISFKNVCKTLNSKYIKSVIFNCISKNRHLFNYVCKYLK